MWINVIDYRGDEGTPLYEKRTNNLMKMQMDFSRWQEHGHQFRCFTQHKINDTDFVNYDDVIEIERGNASYARNTVLDFYKKDEWIGVWDNDATLYWEKLKSAVFPGELDNICENNRLHCFLPIWSGFMPYSAAIQMTIKSTYSKNGFSFTPSPRIKGTMFFTKVCDIRFDVNTRYGEDVEFGIRLTLDNKLCGFINEVSLNEYGGLSTTTAKDDDARKNSTIAAFEYLEKTYGSFKELQNKQRGLWTDPFKLADEYMAEALIAKEYEKMKSEERKTKRLMKNNQLFDFNG